MDYPLLFQHEVLLSLERLKSGGRFPHALIFEGPEGSGKTSAARYAASMLLCRGDNPPCGGCPSCLKSLESHPDFSRLLPENKSRTIPVERVREMRLSAYIAPHEAPARVYFIPEAQRLRAEAQNALLKLIEEPPEAAYFILTVLSRSNLLETVLSRSTIIPMRELSFEERLSALSELFPSAEAERLRGAAGGFPTVGQAAKALSDPAASALAADAARLFGLMTGGGRYEMLTLLCRYEKEREEYIRLMQSFRAVVISRLCSGGEELSALRAGKIIDIIDRTVYSASQNAALPLLSCAAANRLIEAAFSA